MMLIRDGFPGLRRPAPTSFPHRFSLGLVLLATLSVPAFGAWSPRPEILDAPTHMLIKGELRNTFIRPRDIAVGCVKWLGGQVFYQPLTDDTFRVTCVTPPTKQTPLSTMRFNLTRLSGSAKVFITLLSIDAVAMNNPKLSRKLSDVEQFRTMKEIRDNLLDDDVIKEIEEGQDAFSDDWRLCRTPDDSNCMPRGD